MKVTLDVNALDIEKSQLFTDAQACGCDVIIATVTERERAKIDITDQLKKTPEVFILDESELDVGSVASDDDAEAFEYVLRVISNGAFPCREERAHLSDGQKRQLRDAMAFTSHLRDRRDIFVTDDAKGFVRGGRRETLESRFGGRIMTTAEFREHLRSVSRLDA